jgi:beta-lactamase regulating signal transducer with metallopeptidase domain
MLANNYVIESSKYLQEEIKYISYSPSWSFWMMCVWITGALFSLLHTLTGRIGIKYVAKNTLEHKTLNKKILHLAPDLGITRKIKVIVSCRCRIPFTYNFTHPVLVIPYEAKNWPESKLHSILIHELTHIRRHDYLILSLSRFICSVFWFMPLMWIAHSCLQLEQEKICDCVAIEEGERPTLYARYIIDLARTTRSIILWSGIFIMKRRNNMLEKRVSNILEIRQSPYCKNAPLTRSKLLPILILIITVLIIAGSCATRQKVISTDEFFKTYSGTWMNTDYSGVEFDFQKLVISSDGTWETYATDIVEQRSCYGNATLIDSWTDSEGVVWYRVSKIWKCLDERQYEYGKISSSGNTLEYLYRLGPNEVKKWDPDDPSYEYRIFYRQ